MTFLAHNIEYIGLLLRFFENVLSVIFGGRDRMAADISYPLGLNGLCEPNHSNRARHDWRATEVRQTNLFISI